MAADPEVDLSLVLLPVGSGGQFFFAYRLWSDGSVGLMVKPLVLDGEVGERMDHGRLTAAECDQLASIAGAMIERGEGVYIGCDALGRLFWGEGLTPPVQRDEFLRLLGLEVGTERAGQLLGTLIRALERLDTYARELPLARVPAEA